MARRPPVRRRVPGHRVITAADVPARRAAAQVHPPATDGVAFDAPGPAWTDRRIDRIADDVESGKRVEVPVPDRVGIRPGTLLVREWEGVSQRVMVMAEGFAWNGSTYPSLSKVARAITGTRWNGPRFFGLRSAQDGTNGAQA